MTRKTYYYSLLTLLLFYCLSIASAATLPNDNANNSTAAVVACETKAGNHGHCKALRDCYPAFVYFKPSIEETLVEGSVDKCQGANDVTGICCPQEKGPAKHIIEETEEKEDTDKDDEATLGGLPLSLAVLNACSVHGKIIKGEPAQFPFMAAISNKRGQFCGGTLIDDRHILTATHCFMSVGKEDIKNLRVTLGSHDLKDKVEGTEEYSVKRVVRHNEFDQTTLKNDIAILTLDRTVVFTNRIRPICVSVADEEIVGTKSMEVAGWGFTEPTGKPSDVLLKVAVKVWENDLCASSYGAKAPGGIGDTQICAAEEGRDSCSGDSGGPLFTCAASADASSSPSSSSPPSCKQFGVVSWGIGCAEMAHPGVYTRVSSFMKWISRVVEKY